MLSFLRDGFRRAVSMPARRRFLHFLADLKCREGREVVLSYGGMLEREGLLHGGAVKLLHLRGAFPCDERAFNILYLVSSARPAFAEDLVKRCRKLGMQFVWNQNGVGYPGWAGSSAESHNAPMRRLRAQADYVIYQSEFCRTSADKFLGAAASPGEVLFNPVDLEKFRPPDFLPAPQPLRLLAMGTQNYPGRVFAAIDCLKVLRAGGLDAVLTVAGRLEWRNAAGELSRYIENLGLRETVKLLPSFTQDEAAALYQSHHILLHPKYLDPCPTVVIEALASGLPVVGSASGGLPEMVPAACGELIPVPVDWERLITPSGEQFAEAVRLLLPRLGEAAEAARRHAENVFDGSCWVESHRRIFESLLA